MAKAPWHLDPRRAHLSSELRVLLNCIDCVLLDLDGVIWCGETIIPHVPETLDSLRARGKHLRFISDTTLLTRADVVAQFESLGIHGVQPHETYSATYTCALCMQERLADPADRLVRRNIFVLGPDGLHQEMQRVLAQGYATYGPELTAVPYSRDMVAQALTEPILPRPRHAPSVGHAKKMALHELDVPAVVIGLDYAMNMTELAAAVALLQTTDALFVATDPDPADPAGQQRVLLPSSGAILAAAVTALGPRAGRAVWQAKCRDGAPLDGEGGAGRKGGDAAAGPHGGGSAHDRHPVRQEDGGAQTALVLSGAQKLSHVAELTADGTRSAEVPDYVLHSLADFLRAAARITQDFPT